MTEPIDHQAILYGRIMHECFLRAQTTIPTRATTAEEFYGFKPSDIRIIHHEKHVMTEKPQRGIWFRLHDYRVFSELGLPSDPLAWHYDWENETVS